MAGTERREIPVAAAVQRFAATAQQNVAIFATSHRGREVRDGAVGGGRGTEIQHSPPSRSQHRAKEARDSVAIGPKDICRCIG